MPILGPILFTNHSLLCNGQNARQMLSSGFMHYVLKTKTNKQNKTKQNKTNKINVKKKIIMKNP